MAKTGKTQIRAKKFCWEWPQRRGVSGAEPVCGTVLELNGDRRFFLPTENGAWKHVPIHGVMLLVKDGFIPAEYSSLFLAMVAVSTCYLARSRPRGVRHSLSGLRGSYRNAGSFAEDLLGKRRDAWQELYEASGRTRGYSPSQTRKLLGKHLAVLGGTPKKLALPIGIEALFALSESEPDYYEHISPIFRRVADWLDERRQSKAPRVKDLYKWMNERFAHPTKPPLNTDRETLLWAVAHATHFSWSVCHTYGMSQLMLSSRPPLNSAERVFFHFFHTSTALLGVPLWRPPPEYRELLGSVTHQMLCEKKSLKDAQAAATKSLAYHGLLVDDAKKQDNERKEKSALAKSRGAATRTLRGRSQKPRPGAKK